MRFLLLKTLLVLWASLSSVTALSAAASTLHHDLQITLIPEEHRLVGVDNVRVEVDGRSSLVFSLSEKASVKEVLTQGILCSFTFESGQLRLRLKGTELAGPSTFTIAYSAPFNDALPEPAMSADNPGYRVTGIISEKGSFLQSGAGWYPEIKGSRPTFDLRVNAPVGVLAVTAGELLGHDTEDEKTTSTWRISYPLEELSLSAGSYLLQTKRVGRVTAMTYLTGDNHFLSQAYLDATARYLSIYEELIGPYPFEKFAVVENFFPTGYGFPSYTLLGGTVLRLPFIIDTSLPHEIAHSWWGNGVLVDYSKGNWCEGLTTYLADYLIKEMASHDEAREYRLQVLRNFSSLVTPEKDFPLRAFTGRSDPVSQAIGYGKGAFVFHMARQRLGDSAFWKSLREVYRDRLFQKTSWEDFQKAFEKEGRLSLETFFHQWLSRKGAPRFSLDKVTREKVDETFQVKAIVKQRSPFYELNLPVALTSKNHLITEQLNLSKETEIVVFRSYVRPERLSVDPDHHVFRYLDPKEIPPSINSLKGSASVALVLPSTPSNEVVSIAKTLARAMGLRNYRMIPSFGSGKLAVGNEDLILIGFQENVIALNLSQGLILRKDSFIVDGKTFNWDHNIFFGVFPHPENPHRVVALFHPLSLEHAEDVAKKLTHYGRYSYLVFREGRNLVKGVWPVRESPLIYEWHD
jgi:Peptidase family M1 domain